MTRQDSTPPTFAEALGQVTALIGRSNHGQTPWTRVEVVEVDLSRAQDPIPDNARVPAEAYQQRWSEILERVDRDWVNVSACGVQDGALVLAIEWFPQQESQRKRPPGGQVFVMLSGHQGPYRWTWG